MEPSCCMQAELFSSVLAQLFKHSYQLKSQEHNQTPHVAKAAGQLKSCWVVVKQTGQRIWFWCRVEPRLS